MNERNDGLLRVDKDTLSGWQQIVDLLAEISDVPAALIMRVVNEDIEVFVSSQVEGNPYRVGEKENLLGSGLYCEHVIKTRAALHIRDARLDENWCRNPDIKLNMIAYHGHPIIAPGGQVFGTICVLDDEPCDLNNQYDRLIESFRGHVEQDLHMIWRTQQLKEQNKELQHLLSEVKTLRGLLSICQRCKKILCEGGSERDRRSWIPMETYIGERSQAEFSHGVCPDCIHAVFGEDAWREYRAQEFESTEHQAGADA